MKKIYTLFLALILSGCLMAQTPQSFKYQAVARDASGDVVADQAVGMQISILQNSTSGTAVYVETFMPTTNEFGLINQNIGVGTVVSGDLATIDWSTATYFIKSPCLFTENKLLTLQEVYEINLVI
jgi:PBP1b-binding outer membrane lipoprotein LpoB